MTDNRSWVWMNGKFLLASEVRVSPLSDAFMFGYGLFETLRLVDGRPAFVGAHHARMSQSAKRLALTLKASEADWARDAAELARRNGQENGVLKCVLFKDVDGEGELMTTRLNPYSEEDYARGFALRTAIDARRSGGAREKVTSYLDEILARRQARANGFDDTLWVSAEGMVYEGAATNLFAVIEGRLATPPLASQLIPGIARAEILHRFSNYARNHELTRNDAMSHEAIGATALEDLVLGADERALTLAELRGADEVFVTNAVLGVMPVSRIDETVFPLRHNGIVTRLRVAFERWQHESA